MDTMLRMLTDAQIKQVHNWSLDLLENVGILLKSDEACEYYVKAGATVKDQVVKIPRKIIENAFKTTVKRDDFVLYARDPKFDVVLKDSPPTIHAMTMATNVIDPITGERRNATDLDLAKLTVILEQLDTVSSASALVTPQDVPLQSADWYTWVTALKHTTKHIVGGVLGKQGVIDAVRMATLASGVSEEEFLKRPFISVWALTQPPMKCETDMMEIVIEAAKYNLPSVISSGGILGISSPMTVESAIIQTHAEMLASIALTQLVQPGAPVIWSSFIRSMDMLTMGVCMASPESALLRGCMCQMGRFLDLPIQSPLMLKDSKIVDAQAGFENGFSGLVGVLNADFIVAMQLDADLVVDYADLPFTDECMQQLLRFVRPFDFSKERIDFENIEEVGPGGDYLGSDHTVEFFRTETWQPKLSERSTWANWTENGSKDIRQKGLEKALKILEEKGLEPLLSPDICKAMEKIAFESTTYKR